MAIIIVGLGPGNPKHLTREAWDALTSATTIYLRTVEHPVVPALPQGMDLHSFDYLYDRAADFDAVYTAIAQEVLNLGRRDEVIYAVPGHPLVGEASVERILEAASREGLAVRVVAGLSFVEPVLTALGFDALAGLQLVDALDVATAYHPPLNPDFPGLVAQLYNQRLAADVKLTLMNQYPAEHTVTLVHGAGTDDERTISVPLYELDRQAEVAHLTTLFVPSLPQLSSFEGFQQTIARLRAPDGCPWDREQTHDSLRATLLEETYETLVALDQGDSDALCEELGDLLLQIVMHSQIAVEEGEFSMADVIAGVDAKIKRRHPHVWGEVRVSSSSDVLPLWEALKAEERNQDGSAHMGDRSLLDGVPKTLPALAQAEAYGRRAARVGFDWPNPQGVADKIGEEIQKLRDASETQKRTAELGDLLFAVVNWARWLDIDPEAALRQANQRFARRFSWLASEAGRRMLALDQLSPDQLEALWHEAKRNVPN